MNKKIKAAEYVVTIHHDAIVKDKKPWGIIPAYDTHEVRYCIISNDTGEVLDDAQGYGYKTAQSAYIAFTNKNRDKSKNKKRLKKEKYIEQWMKQNEFFVDLMDDYVFEFSKRRMPPCVKFNASFVRYLLDEQDLHPDFTAGELLRVWQKK